MNSKARFFFAGVATTFVVLGIGFAGGLMLASAALQDRPAQMRASSESSPGIKVILTPPAPQVTPAAQTPEDQPQVQAVKGAEEPIKEAEKADPKQGEQQLRAERRRQADRQARRIAAARTRQQVEPQHGHRPGIMAFGDDGPRLFGN